MRNKKIFIVAVVVVLFIASFVLFFRENSNSIDSKIKDIRSNVIHIELREEVSKVKVEVINGDATGNEWEADYRYTYSGWFGIRLDFLKINNQLSDLKFECMNEEDEIIETYYMYDILVQAKPDNEQISQARYLFIDPWYFDSFEEVNQLVNKSKLRAFHAKLVKEALDFEAISKFKNLEYLQINFKETTGEAKELAKLKKLKSMVLGNGFLEDTSFLREGFKNIDHISVRVKNSNLSDFNHLGNLTSLNVYADYTTDKLKNDNLETLIVRAEKGGEIASLSEIGSSKLELLYVVGEFSGELKDLPVINTLNTLVVTSTSVKIDGFNCGDVSTMLEVCKINEIAFE